MKKLKEIDLGYTNGNRRFGREPYTIAFAYPRNHKPILVKGDADTVEEYLEKNYPNCFYALNIHRNKRSWVVFRAFVNGYDVYINKKDVNNSVDYSFESRKPTKERHVLTVYNQKTREQVFKKQFRKMPRSWIKELDQFI
jgi:ribosomal protein L25 (general stress protein Ctc)